MYSINRESASLLLASEDGRAIKLRQHRHSTRMYRAIGNDKDLSFREISGCLTAMQYRRKAESSASVISVSRPLQRGSSHGFHLHDERSLQCHGRNLH